MMVADRALEMCVFRFSLRSVVGRLIPALRVDVWPASLIDIVGSARSEAGSS